MKTSFVPFVALWGLLALIVLALIVWRKVVANQEDDSLHVLEGEPVVAQQTALAQKLEFIDKWGKALTVALVGYGLVLAGVYFYQVWNATSTAVLG